VFPISGIGIDLVQVERLAQLGESARNRLFTAKELAECLQGSEDRQKERLAGRFAGKEAVLKALGTGLAEGLRWHDVEILSEKNGAPRVQLQGKALQKMEELGAQSVLLSITHESGLAMAMAALTGHSSPKL